MIFGNAGAVTEYVLNSYKTHIDSGKADEILRYNSFQERLKGFVEDIGGTI